MLKTLFEPEESADTNKVRWTVLVVCQSDDVTETETLYAAALRGVAMETGRPIIRPRHHRPDISLSSVFKEERGRRADGRFLLGRTTFLVSRLHHWRVRHQPPDWLSKLPV